MNHGAGFVVAICGDMMTMPGLPKVGGRGRRQCVLPALGVSAFPFTLTLR